MRQVCGQPDAVMGAKVLSQFGQQVAVHLAMGKEKAHAAGQVELQREEARARACVSDGTTEEAVRVPYPMHMPTRVCLPVV